MVGQSSIHNKNHEHENDEANIIFFDAGHRSRSTKITTSGSSEINNFEYAHLAIPMLSLLFRS